VRAVVVRGNPDGSLKVTRSRVLSGSDLASTVLRVSLSWMVGFMGLFSSLKGAVREARAAHERRGHVGAEDHRAHELLAEAGPNAAIVLVRCQDEETRRLVVGAADQSAQDWWDGSLAEFLGALDPGSSHDWVRAAIGEPTGSGKWAPSGDPRHRIRIRIRIRDRASRETVVPDVASGIASGPWVLRPLWRR